MSDVSKFNLFGEEINVKDLVAREFIGEQRSINTTVNNKINTAENKIVTNSNNISDNTNSINGLNGRLSATNNDVANLTSRVDTIANLPIGSTTGDAELQDIRIDFKGNTYTNAGGEVRGSDEFINGNCIGLSDTMNLSWSTFEDVNSAYQSIGNSGDIFNHYEDKLYVRFTAFDCTNKGMVIKNKYPDFYKIRVAKYNSTALSSNTLVEMVSKSDVYEHCSFYALEKGYYYSVSVIRTDGQAFTDTTLLNLKRNLSKGVASSGVSDVAIVSNYNELVSAIGDGIKFIFINANITASNTITINNDVVIFGGNKTLTGNGSITNLIYVNSGANVIINDLKINYAKSTVVRIAGNCIMNNCEVWHSVENDGIAPIDNANVYIYNCKVHDNYDEGVSTHNNSYCEVIGGEFYRNGFVYGTSERGAVSSFGGVHLGGGKMGVVKNVYSHNNRTYGVALIRFQGLEMTDKEICIGNTCMNNGSDGIKVTGCNDLLLTDNRCSHNGGYAIHFGTEDGLSEDVQIGSMGYCMYNIFNNNVNNVIAFDDEADLGVEMYGNTEPPVTYDYRNQTGTFIVETANTWNNIYNVTLQPGFYILSVSTYEAVNGNKYINIDASESGSGALLNRQLVTSYNNNRIYILRVTEPKRYYIKINNPIGEVQWNVTIRQLPS